MRRSLFGSGDTEIVPTDGNGVADSATRMDSWPTPGDRGEAGCEWVVNLAGAVQRDVAALHRGVIYRVMGCRDGRSPACEPIRSGRPRQRHTRYGERD
ncbi:hypothetical protein A5748_22245 [Nocardia sp. 852002-51244_SCH5132740]|nr:hypothetical protein A5748_22245 [Nocardia sp. 852002-51244_SCH5132740]